MKIKKFAVFAAILAFAGFANAGALYWQVDTSAADSAYKGDWDSASLFVVKTDGTEELLDGLVAGAAPTLTDLGGYGSTGYSFYVELYNAGKSVYTGYKFSYDLLKSGYISTTGVLTPTVLATGGWNGASVPEPTSGVLLLIGGAMLALRRRRA